MANQKYTVLDADGIPQGFYSVPDIHTLEQLPDGAVAITDEQWIGLHDGPKGTKALHFGIVVPRELPPRPPQVPAWVASSSAELALYQAGLLDQVNAIVANHPYPPVRIYFAKANTWRRDNPYVQALGHELGLDDDEIDALFIQAGTYE